jgi:hypothetical protein
VPWVVSGSCNHCGACCLPPVVVDNPCKPITEDRCRFYDDDEPSDGRFGHCLILGRGGKPIENVRDRFNNKITQAQIDWFTANCPNWPMSCLEEWRAGTFEKPPTCGYELTWFED